MKILFTIPEVGTHGGTERWAYEVLRRLAPRHEITVHAAIAEGLPGSVRVRHVPRLRKPGLANFTSFAVMHALLRSGSGRYDVTAATGADDPSADVISVHFVAETRRRMMADGTIAPAGGRLRRAHARAYAELTARAERWTFTRPGLHALLCVSDLVAREVVELCGADPARVRVVPNGVDVQTFRPADPARRAAARLALGLAHDARVVLFVGGDWDRKGLCTLIAAHAGAADPRQVLLVAGHGDPRDFPAPPTARFLGAVPEVSPLYAAADVFAYPTLYEPFGLAPLEAMAAGVPTIVSRAAGVAGLCQDGRDALLLERPGDAEALARAIQTLLDDPELHLRIAAGGRATAERHSWDETARKTEAAYLEAAEARARAGR